MPCDAGVVFVHSDDRVNLLVTDHAGNVHARTQVLFVHDDRENLRGHMAYAEWMPYQKGASHTPPPAVA